MLDRVGQDSQSERTLGAIEFENRFTGREKALGGRAWVLLFWDRGMADGFARLGLATALAVEHHTGGNRRRGSPVRGAFGLMCRDREPRARFPH